MKLERDQSLGPLHSWNRPEGHPVREAEDHGVGTDADREREHGNGSEPGAPGKLANGMHTIVLPKQTQNDTVAATIELRFGDATTLKGKNAAAQFAGGLLMRGTKTKTAQQLRDEMQKLNARITVSGGGGGGFFSSCC